MNDCLSAENVRPRLQTRWMGRRLEWFEELDSTNTKAAELAREGAEEGTVVVAEAQARGRGRMGRSWVSPPRRNLYLSIVLRPPLATHLLSQVSLLAGVATCDAVREWCDASIKWPNDILAGGRKVAGILIEMEGEGGRRFVVLGIGVNLNMQQDDFPADLREKAGSLAMATGAAVDRVAFGAQLLGQLEHRYDELVQRGFAPIARAWHERAQIVGRSVRVEGAEGRVEGTAVGVDEDGALRLRLASGGEHRVLAGDVTVLAIGG